MDEKPSVFHIAHIARRIEQIRGGNPAPETLRLASGRVLRLKGKGMPSKSGAGDLYATVRIMLPEKGDADLDELMKKWRDGKPYDPRREMS